MAGLQAGDYDIGLDIGNDQYEVLKDYPGVTAEILHPTNWDVIFLNWKSPMFSNQVMRDAFQAALESKAMLLSGRGSEEFIRLDPGLMMKETVWYTDAGIERYNMNNPELAKQKLTEAGYDGTPLRFLTTQEYSYMYGEAIVAKQQLEQVGFTVDLRVTDWATVVQNRAKPEEWDAFTTGHGFVPDPSQISYVGQMNVYPGWWDNPESLDLAGELLAESDFDTRKGHLGQNPGECLYAGAGDQDRRFLELLVPSREDRRLGASDRARCAVLESLVHQLADNGEYRRVRQQ